MNPAENLPSDATRWRADFPVLAQTVHGKPLVYLDSAASAQKPVPVLEAMDRFYRQDYANIHRGVHELSQRATQRYEEARATVRRFINAAADEEIVFTRGATEAINLVAASWGGVNLGPGDEVVITELEHHANIVPWQLLAGRGVRLVAAPVTDDGVVTVEAVRACFTPRTKLVAVAQVSNALGTVLPVAAIVAAAHERGLPVLIDGCQAVCHRPVDVQALGADFYVFSGHKLYGPTGIGVLYGRRALLDAMPPYQGGGDMIESVSLTEGTVFRAPPHRFEAGTPAIAEAVGLAAAIAYVGALGLDRIAAQEQAILAYATAQLRDMPGARIVGTAPEKAAVLSFVVEGAHPSDIGTLLDQQGIAVRTGHHCAQPIMTRFDLPGGTVRASFALYTTPEDIDRFIAALGPVLAMVRP